MDIVPPTLTRVPSPNTPPAHMIVMLHLGGYFECLPPAQKELVMLASVISQYRIVDTKPPTRWVE